MMKAVTVRQMTRLTFTMVFRRGFSSSKQAADTGSGGAAGAFSSSFFLSIPHSQQRADESLDWDRTVDTEDEESGKEGGRSSAQLQRGQGGKTVRSGLRKESHLSGYGSPFRSHPPAPVLRSLPPPSSYSASLLRHRNRAPLKRPAVWTPLARRTM